MTEIEQAAIQAQSFVEKNCSGDGVIGVATEWVNGVPVIKVFVDKKKPEALCVNPVRKAVKTDAGPVVQTDVVEIRGGFRAMVAKRDGIYAQAAPGYDKIYNRILGGLQIAPDRAGWVGTLGGIFMATIGGETIYGGLTNAHVTGLHAAPGTLMMQPDSSYGAGGFGRVAWVSPFSSRGGNLMDAGVINCHATEGKWAGVGKDRWTVFPSQFGIGGLSLRWKDPVVGMKVWKSGRTSGVVKGTCTSVDATTSVGYDEGTFDFIKQAFFKGDNGKDMSQPGDSGSYILEQGTNDVVAHLFAGGGGITIAYPIRWVIDAVGGRFAVNPPLRSSF